MTEPPKKTHKQRRQEARAAAAQQKASANTLAAPVVRAPMRNLWPLSWLFELFRLLKRSLSLHPLLFAGSICIAGGWVTEKVVTESNREKTLYINEHVSEIWRKENQAVENRWRVVNMYLHDTSAIQLSPEEFNAKILLATSQELDCFYGLRQEGMKLQYGEDSDKAADNMYRDSSAKNDILVKQKRFDSIIILLDSNRSWYGEDQVVQIRDYPPRKISGQKLIKSFAARRAHQLQRENEIIRAVFIILVVIGTLLIQINNARSRENEDFERQHLVSLIESLAHKPPEHR